MQFFIKLGQFEMPNHHYLVHVGQGFYEKYFLKVLQEITVCSNRISLPPAAKKIVM